MCVCVCVTGYNMHIPMLYKGDVMSKEGSWYDRVCVGSFVTGLIYYFSVVNSLCVFVLCAFPTPTHICFTKSLSFPLSLSLSLSPKSEYPA